ncbi:MAG: M24 family metallopeptidase [Phycisphaerae bacterium]
MTPVQEMDLKRSKVADFLDRHQLDAVLLTRRANFAWLTAGCANHVGQATEIGNATLVVTRDRIRCVANTIESPRMRTEELLDRSIEVIEFAWFDPQDAARVWAAVVGRRAAADVILPGMPDDVAPLPVAFNELRWPLCEPEMRRYRTLGTAVGAGLQEVCRQVQPGMTELEIAAALAARLNREGIRTPVLLVAADERIDRYRHPLPTPRRVDSRVMVAVSAERAGLFCSATRLVSFGPLPPGLRHRHDAVVRVDAVLIAGTRPGRTLGEVFREAQQSYAEAGYPDEWKRHHQGGSTGYLGREVRAEPSCDVVILANQAFAWNPSIAGTKSEDTILVTDGGPEILTQGVDWPMIDVRVDGRILRRPDILTWA